VALLGSRTRRETKKDHTEANVDQMKIVIYVKARCQRCWRVKRLLRRRNYAFEVIDVSVDDEMRIWLVETTGSKTVPRVFVGGRLVGGFDEVRTLDRSGDLDRLVQGEV
jgi:glutaredoxin 3